MLIGYLIFKAHVKDSNFVMAWHVAVYTENGCGLPPRKFFTFETRGP